MQSSRAVLISGGIACAMMTGAIPAGAAVTPSAPAHAQYVHASSAVSANPAISSARLHWRIDERLALDYTQSPAENPTGYSFLDVEPVGPSDAWAVGTSGYYDLFWGHPVWRHWHDGKWISPPVPAWMTGAKPARWVHQLDPL